MPQDNSVGVLTGLIFVALFLVVIASIHGAAKFLAAPAAIYELAGVSKPAD